MKASSLCEVIVAAHLSYYVDSVEFPERGGLMLISPPGNMKSTFIKVCLDPYSPKAQVLSDLNVETIGRMKNHIASGQITTLALPALEKIYERNPQTAKNVEGHIKGFVDEGFAGMSFSDHRMLGQILARCLVVGGVVHTVYEKRFTEWEDNGFARRFLWSSFQLTRPEVLTEAVHNWQRIEFHSRVPMAPSGKIKMSVTKEESTELRRMLEQQNCAVTAFSLIKKILSVLKWKYNDRSDQKLPMIILRDFGTSLGRRMAQLDL